MHALNYSYIRVCYALFIVLISSLNAYATSNNSNYCVAEGKTNYEWIKNIKINDYELNDRQRPAKGYSNNSSQLSSNLGQDLVISITPGFTATTYTQHLTVFLDINGDQKFSGVNEEYYLGNSNKSEAITTKITIPQTTSVNMLKMRVVMRYGTRPQPCSTNFWGDVIDFNINLQNTNADDSRTSDNSCTSDHLDVSFGQSGIVTINEIRNSYSQIELLPDGGLIISGQSKESTYTHSFVKLHKDGKRDLSFGNQGLVKLDQYLYLFRGLKIDSKNRIVAFGTEYIDNYGVKSAKAPVIIRLTANGELDNSFGLNGKVTLPTQFPSGTAYKVGVSNGNSLLVALSQSPGNSQYTHQYADDQLFKLNQNGIIDQSFGSNGSITLTNVKYGVRGIIRANYYQHLIFGDVVTNVDQINNSASSSGIILLLNRDGSTVPYFGRSGIVISPSEQANSTVYNAAVNYNYFSKIITGSVIKNSSPVLQVFNRFGNIDQNFGNHGQIRLNEIYNNLGIFLNLGLTYNGKIRAVTKLGGLSVVGFGFTANGRKDLTFANQGILNLSNLFFDAADAKNDFVGRLIISGRLRNNLNETSTIVRSCS